MTIRHANNLTYPMTDSALRWLELILNERFGYEWQLTRCANKLSLALRGAEGFINFDKLEPGFTKPRSDLEIAYWDAEPEGWTSKLVGPIPAPGDSRLPEPLIENRESHHIIHYDILGLTYWMLTRLEEFGRPERDQHDRFPAVAAHAFMNKYLDRPIVDEWLAVLAQVISRQWPSIKLRSHSPKVNVTCDLDNPYQLDYRANTTLRGFARDIMKHRNPVLAFKNLHQRTQASLGNFSGDKNLSAINWIMDVNDNVGNNVLFYVMVDRTHPYDGFYDIGQPIIREILESINHRGHTIGLHPSYMSYNDRCQLHREANNIRATLDKLGICQTSLKSRQHYLRWKTVETSRYLSSAQIDTDSTLAFAEHCGFRCGTSFAFTMYDIENRKTLNLKQQPLILMETTLTSENYMGLHDPTQITDIIAKLKQRAFLFNGQFTLLWHNCSLVDDHDRELYLQAISR